MIEHDAESNSTVRIGHRVLLLRLVRQYRIALLALAVTVPGCSGSGTEPTPPFGEVPAAPSNLAAVPASTSVLLSWDDNSSNESGFRIERAPGGTSAFDEIAATGSDVVSYMDLDVTPGTAFSYRIHAYGPDGASTNSNTISVTTTMTGVASFAFLAAGSHHTCALALDGSAWCWGSNKYGQLGDGTRTNRTRPIEVIGDLSYTTLAAGDTHTCGVTAPGTVYCWGTNSFGQLGTGTTDDRLTPAPVSGIPPVATLALGRAHSCALDTGGAAWCWGWNDNGQLGDGSTINRFTPVQVGGGRLFVELTAGYSHACGRTTTGSTYCWGFNGQGTVGDGTRITRYVPTLVAGDPQFASVVAGGMLNCARTASNRVFCWGYNPFGGIGDGTATDRDTPTPAAGTLTFIGLALGYAHTCGITAPGEPWCWGHNYSGQVGDGSDEHWRLTPVRVDTDLQFQQLVAGDAHTCGRTSTNAIYCWGTNFYGELGDGISNPIRAPNPVSPP
ncbi:MAG TPA: hypothetical protein VFG84_02115 [Gemmatimonadaceae bacterium]|nr:hypothetical protein [Gemmatimonadaceae bacterium]